VNQTRYNTTTNTIPLIENPAADGIVVAYPTNVALAPRTDPYFRGFDNAFPDYYRYAEWAREFDNNYLAPECRAPERSKLAAAPSALPCAPHAQTTPRGTGMPSLSLVRFMHDHTGSFGSAIDGVNVPELQVADNDYAVGLLVQKIASSQCANNTLIFVLEDDAQDGGDHVDSHRSVALVAGAFVKQGVVISTPYNMIDFVRTMEEVLGLPPTNLNDALARPMADIFNTTPRAWKLYGHSLSASLYPWCVAAASPAAHGLSRAKAVARCGLLGAGQRRSGFHVGRSRRSGRFQSPALERRDGQYALPHRAERKGSAA
jgi:hypothetical protein